MNTNCSHNDVSGLLANPTPLQIFNVPLQEGDIWSTVAKLLHMVVNMLPGHFKLFNNKSTVRTSKENST